MKRLPRETRNSLQKEAIQWEAAISRESSEEIQELLNNAESFRVPRPARQPVSLRMDPFDISIIRRLARKKGVTHTQLMAMWLRERIESERGLYERE